MSDEVFVDLICQYRCDTKTEAYNIVVAIEDAICKNNGSIEDVTIDEMYNENDEDEDEA